MYIPGVKKKNVLKKQKKKNLKKFFDKAKFIVTGTQHTGIRTHKMALYIALSRVRHIILESCSEVKRNIMYTRIRADATLT